MALLLVWTPGCLQTALVGVADSSGCGNECPTRVFYPTDDAYLEYDPPPATGVALMDNNRLKVRSLASAGVRVSYLRFDLADLEGEVVGAALSLKEAPGQPRTGTWDAYLGAHAAWTESTLSLTDPPTSVTYLSSITGEYPANAIYEWTVTPTDLAGSACTILLRMEDGAGNDPSFWSKDGQGEPGWRAPELRVTLAQ